MIVDYIHRPDQHEGLVLSSFCLQTGEPDSVFRELLRGGMVVKVDQTQGKRSDGLPICPGWAARMPGGPLVYAYVKHELRDFPIIPRLLQVLGLDNGEEIPVMFHTRQIRAIGRAWNIPLVPWLAPEVRN